MGRQHDFWWCAVALTTAAAEFGPGPAFSQTPGHMMPMQPAATAMPMISPPSQREMPNRASPYAGSGAYGMSGHAMSDGYTTGASEHHAGAAETNSDGASIKTTHVLTLDSL